MIDPPTPPTPPIALSLEEEIARIKAAYFDVTGPSRDEDDDWEHSSPSGWVSL